MTATNARIFMNALLYLLGMALFAGTFSSCETDGLVSHPEPIRPQGSGGRGDSPGYFAETSSSVSPMRRN